jgi:hypothetical protein
MLYPGYCLILIFAASGPAQVVIDEIHYHPATGSSLEFIELYNPGGSEVPLGGWRIDGDSPYSFPDGSRILPRGRIVVARSPRVLADRFGLAAETAAILGPLPYALDDGSGSIVLIDGDGLVVDSVNFGDEPPWDPGADGEGGSLERLCPSAPSCLPSNWISYPSLGPTPLRPSHGARCPPPDPPAPSVAINEIHYHPAGDADASFEFVEIHNPTGRTLDLSDWCFGQGIFFLFPTGTSLPPGGHLAVYRNLAAARDALGIEGMALGDFDGQLSNRGERISLFDRRGNLVDSVLYGEGGDWPAGPDGNGPSLERISPQWPGDDPANWAPAVAVAGDRWFLAASTGPATSSSIQFFLLGAGEYTIDDVRLEATASPGENLLPSGSFDEGMEGWKAAGNHADTTWDPTGGPDGSGALRIVANGRGTGAPNGVSFDLTPALVRNDEYRLSFRYRPGASQPGLIARLSGASSLRGVFVDVGTRPPSTPGSANTAARAVPPPFIRDVRREPREPGSTDPVKITARVRGEAGPVALTLDYWVDFGKDPAGTVAMADDGLHGDGSPDDGRFGVTLPTFPHNTAVTYRISAEDASGTRTIPATGDPAGFLGFYVNDDRPESPLPIFHLLLDHRSATPPLTLLRGLNCATWRAMAFASEGDLYPNSAMRQRGQSVCGSQKPYLKVRFPHGREFQDRRKINLQSIWTDKSLVREHLAWELFGEMANPYCTTRFVRLHVNGKYFGLYLELEHPDARFLERNGLNPEGNLYKAVASRDEKMADYRTGFEKKTNEDGDFSDLKTFLDAMNTVPATSLRAFWEANVVEDSIIDYQAGQVLTNNSDYPHKNHYHYHDTSTGLWRAITWDMDLTFGKLWDGTYGGVLNDKMHTPGITPWYTTRVAGEGTGNFLLDRFFAATPDRWYQRAYRVRLWLAIEEKYAEAAFAKKIEAIRDLIFEEQAEDMKRWGRSPSTANDPSAPRDFDPNLDRVRAHIATRRAYLRNYIEKTDRLAPPSRLKITELYVAPPGGEVEFVEVCNTTGKEIDASGWTIEGIGFVFPPGSTFADGEVAVVARDPGAFLGRYGEGIRVFGPFTRRLDPRGMELRVKDAGPGYPASVEVLRYGIGPGWPRIDPEDFRSIELTAVSSSRDNDVGAHWRPSILPGGTPGWIDAVLPAVPFRRGDCGGDGRVTVTDPIVILRILFQGAELPSCTDGCDANGDRVLDLSDPIVLLRYLFLGEGGIPEPGPVDCRAVEGSYCDKSNCQEG